MPSQLSDFGFLNPNIAELRNFQLGIIRAYHPLSTQRIAAQLYAVVTLQTEEAEPLCVCVCVCVCVCWGEGAGGVRKGVQESVGFPEP